MRVHRRERARSAHSHPTAYRRHSERPFYRYKRTFGNRLRSRHEDTQRAEALIGCRILNRMTELGMPESYPVGP